MVKMDFWERIMIPERVRIPLLGGWLYQALSKRARRYIRKLPFDKLSLNKSPRKMKITCTLTTFPDRIDTVQYTIKSLFDQTMKPDRIVLWLADSEFNNFKFPDSIIKLQERGLEIRYCENFFGHKRYYKMIDEQKNDELIVMFDDDIIFPRYLLERLYDKWLEFPDAVICDRGQVLTFEGDDILNPGRWSAISKVGLDSPSYRVLASPGGGCLFPPKALFKDANNTDIISKYALKTGDIWLMFMAVQNDVKILRTYQYHRTFILSEPVQTVQLGKEAIYQGRYVKTFHELSEAYPHAYQNMLSETKQ